MFGNASCFSFVLLPQYTIHKLFYFNKVRQYFLCFCLNLSHRTWKAAVTVHNMASFTPFMDTYQIDWIHQLPRWNQLFLLEEKFVSQTKQGPRCLDTMTKVVSTVALQFLIAVYDPFRRRFVAVYFYMFDNSQFREKLTIVFVCFFIIFVNKYCLCQCCKPQIRRWLEAVGGFMVWHVFHLVKKCIYI